MPISPQERKFHNKHNRNIAIAEAQIDSAFAAMVQDAARLYQRFNFDLPEGGAFSFEQASPAAKKAAHKIFADMRNRLIETIKAGADAADKLSEKKAEKLAKMYGESVQLRREETTARSLQEISEAVWKQSEQARAEMELALSVALKSGTSADNFSREIRGYLNEPNKLFRRVRDEFGNLVLSKAAAAYHPGRGVYRSSYKNARRLAATEINMAYRKADFDRWQKMKFVVGIHIELSREHPYYDMCDELAGDYPKDFIFVGWHPHCRCIATPILQNIEDFKNGVPPEKDLFKVDRVPDSFNKWVKNNEIRINRALSGQASMPFFLKDNKGAMEKALEQKLSPPQNPFVNGKRAFDEFGKASVEYKEYRKELQTYAKKAFAGKIVFNHVPILISTKGIKEYLNQPHTDYLEKNELVRNLPNLIEKSIFVGRIEDYKGKEDVDSCLLFRTSELTTESLLIILQKKNGTYLFYSISDKLKAYKSK